MTASGRATRLASLALLTATLAGSCVLARAQAAPPVPGGAVPSVLSLSLSEPSRFVRRGSAYVSIIRAEVTATDAPTRLSLADGEAGSGRRRGHLASGKSILAAPLRAASGGPFRSLDARVAPSLTQWRKPVSHAAAQIRLRQVAPSRRALRNHRKLLLVTLMAAGP